MNDVRRLDIKIANLQRQKRQRRVLGTLIGAMGIVVILAVITNADLRSQVEKLQTVAYAQQIEEREQVLELTVQERELVERVVAAEARGESFEGQMAVAQVIRDRCLISGLPVEKVVYVEEQFAGPYSGEISSTTEAAVGFVFEGGHNIFEMPVTHFYAHDLIEAPDWTTELIFIEEIGGHSFYTEAKYAAS